MVDPDWHPPAGIWVRPIYGWGFVETVNGSLAPPFEISVTETGCDIGRGVRGWRGSVVSLGHRYFGLGFKMSPLHTDWTRTVNIRVQGHEDYAFSGMADTSGLECWWK